MTSHARLPHGTPTCDSYGRTDGRTNGDGNSPTGDTSSSVTRTRTYGEVDGLSEHQRRRRGEWTVLTPENLAAIEEMARDGLTDIAIADELGISTHSVGRGRQHLGLPVNDPRKYIDEVAVQRAVSYGVVGRLTPAETREAVRILTARGRSNRFIAERLGVTKRTVDRWRVRMGGTAHIRQEGL